MTQNQNYFSDTYSLGWRDPNQPWELISGEQRYMFQLPKSIMRKWLDNTTNDLEMKKNAVYCKTSFMSNMIVYYTQNGQANIKMISIDKYALDEARKTLYKLG